LTDPDAQNFQVGAAHALDRHPSALIHIGGSASGYQPGFA
jgi:hypothetical protein